jgi:hypothetical protein
MTVARGFAALAAATAMAPWLLFSAPAAHADESLLSDCSSVVSQETVSSPEPSVQEPGTLTHYALGGQDYTYVAPPASWTPLLASDTELSFYNFPARPTDPAGLAAWTDEWTHYSGVGSPAMCATNLTAAATDILTDLSGTTYSNIWAGEVATQATNYTRAYASLVDHADTGCTGQTDSHVRWTGLGGYGTHELLQNGIISGDHGAQDLAWIEALNSTYDTGVRTIPATTFAVRFGDRLNVATLYNATTKSVTYQFHNLTTGQAYNPAYTNIMTTNQTTHVDSTQPIATMYNGSSAEVIDERTTVLSTKTPTPLRQFPTSSYTNASSSTGGGTALTNIRSQTHANLPMIMKNGTKLAGVGYDATADAFHDTWVACGANGA